MKKNELMDAMTHIVEQKHEKCVKRIQELDSFATAERSALSIQKNIYKNAKTFINFAGDADELPTIYLQRLKSMLTNEDALREIYEQTENEEQVVLAVYLHNILFLQQNFLSRYQQEAKIATDPCRKIEAKVKANTIEDLLVAYRTCFRTLGGRKDLII